MTVRTLTETAPRYLLRDPDANVGFLYCLQRGTADVAASGENGVLLYDRQAGIWLLSARYCDETRRWLELAKGCGTMFAVGRDFVPEIQTKLGLAESMECDQFVYRGAPFSYAPRLCLSSPSPAELEEIIRSYGNLSPEELREHAADGSLLAAHDFEGRMVGFAGRHSEGSLGMLFVFPEHRRLGYAEELEKYMVNLTLSGEMLPFCHVQSWNEASMRLQSKLGFTRVPEKVYWLF